jgi:hypothetical protein
MWNLDGSGLGLTNLRRLQIKLDINNVRGVLHDMLGMERKHSRLRDFWDANHCVARPGID